MNNNGNSNQIKPKELEKMLDLTKIYTTKGSATRAFNKAVKDGEIESSNYVISTVDGGFQIILNHDVAIAEAGPSEFCDEELEEKWMELKEVQLDTDGAKLAENWYGFTAGTSIEEIHAWFDSEYSEGLEALKCKMNNDNGDDDNNRPETKNEIVKTANENPESTNAAKAVVLADHHKTALTALAGVKVLAEKNENERAGVWFPFSEIYNSTAPADLPRKSMGGIMRALINRGLIQFLADGKEIIGKKSVAVCLTNEGLLALQS